MPVDAVKRVGEVAGQGICGGDGAGHPAGGYCASMGDDWRVRANRLGHGDLAHHVAGDPAGGLTCRVSGDRGGAEGDLMELNGWTSPQMLRRYGASARGARARHSYDRIMDDTT